MNKNLKFFAVTLMVVLGAACGRSEEVNVYSYRKEALIKPLLDRFSAKTGIKVNLVTGKADALFQRLKNEGENSPADVLITVDAGRLHRAMDAGLLQPIDSTVLNAAVPGHLRDPANHWFGLSVRSRPIMYRKDKVDPARLSSYEALAGPEWRGRVCIRSSSNIYNQSLLASMIASDGEARAEAWARAIVANMARAPQGNDTAQLKAVAVGECDIAITNTYYLGRLQNSDDEADRKIGEAIGVFFPNQDGRGAHINVSGIGVTRHAKNRSGAVKLMEFLVSDEAQAWYAEKNYEYPVKASVPVSDKIKAWGYPFKMDRLNLARLGELNATAVKTFDRSGWK